MDHRIEPTRKASWSCAVVILLGGFFTWSGVSAQNMGGRYPWQEYNERTRASEMVAPLKSDLFGDQISLYDATAELSVVDVDLPGNSSLPVQLRRRLKVESKKEMEFFGGFGEWDLEVPYLYGVFTSIWKWNEAGNGSTGRCSEPWYPKVGTFYNLDEIWSGNYLHLPAEGDRLMLYVGKSELLTPQDGARYNWTTRDFLSFSCKSGVSGGSGEGFVLLTPQGVRYTFDVMIEKSAGRLNKSGSLVPRAKVFLAASKVEDRFGNWVEYRYEGARLSEIIANDGRRIQLNYNGANISSVTANGRTWTYGYGANTDNNYPYNKDRLTEVVQPDGRRWQYSYSGTLAPQYTPLDFSGGELRLCPSAPHPKVQFTVQATHPSGAQGTFEFALQRHNRTGVLDSSCMADVKPQTWRLRTPDYFDVYSLKSKTVAGPGLEPQLWRYTVQNAAGGRVKINDLPCKDCEKEKTVNVFQPDGSRLTYHFGTLYYYNDGRLLGVDTWDAQGNKMRSESHQYVDDADMAAQPFPNDYGNSWGVDDASGAFIRPLKETTIWQDGETYVKSVAAFDSLARPIKVIKSNSLNYGRYDQSEQIDYHDNLSRWVLGQTRRVQQLSPRSIEVSRTEFDAADLPSASYAFGRLTQQLTYAADGTPSSVSDALGHITIAGGWKRGTPQTVQYPDGSSETAVVDDNGWLTSVTSRAAATINYQYDAMGRLVRVQQPVADSVAWNDTEIEFAPIDGDEYGIGAGHWRQVVSTGNARRITYFDALWQPLLSEAFDASNRSGSLSQVLKRFDGMGRQRFESYPSRDIVGVGQQVAGTRTAFDALGRPVLSEQDSEIGILSSRTEYLSGGRARTINPRNFATTTTHMAWDQPTNELPVAFSLPEGAFVDIDRDSVGKPLSIRRRDAGATTAVIRRYVYDAFEQLCKSIEPETGTTVMSYDAAGNLAWSAGGLALSDPSSCSTNEDAVATRRVARSYDSMNRLNTLKFPDGNGDQQWQYWPSGLVRQITTVNDGVTAINSYQYNKRGLLIGESLQQAGGELWSLGYGYSANGHLASHLYPNGESILYAPNALGQATQVGDYAAEVGYYPNGAMSGFRYGNGLRHHLKQNARGLPERSQDQSLAITALDDSYDYDANGNVVAISDGRVAAQGNRDMAYDGLDRLVSVGSSTFGDARYGYDVLDNLTKVQVAGRNHGYLYDASNRLTNVISAGNGATIMGLAYDVQGNLALKNGQAFVFDSGNRLRQALSRESYRYDGHGRRIQSSDVEKGEILSFYGSDGVLRYQKNAREAQSYAYLYINGSLLARSGTLSEPAAPLVTLPGYATDGAFTVRWTAVTGTERYELAERSGGDWNVIHAGSGNELHVTDRARGQYEYRARACNVAGCSAWGASASIFVVLPPTVPGAISVPALGASGSYTIGWSAPMPRAVGETAYVLEEGVAGQGWTEVQRGPAMSRTFTDRQAGSYGYRVKACNPYGCSPYTAEGWIRVVYPPAPPTLIDPGERFGGNFTIAWTGSADSASYQLDESFNGGAWSRVYSGASLDASLMGRQMGQYRYRLQACGEAGCSDFSTAIAVNVVVIPPDAPLVSVPGGSTDGNYTVSWTAVATADYYVLFERQPGGGLAHIQTTYGGAFAVGGRGTGRWGYVVQACNRAGCGPMSREVFIDVLLPPQVPAFSDGLRAINYGVRSTAYSCHIKWKAVPFTDRYEVRNQKGELITLKPDVLGLSSTQQKGGFPKTMECSTQLEIRSCNASGCSGWSPVWDQPLKEFESRI